MPRNIPDRWLNYKSHGDVISETNILPFKVPLPETIGANLQSEQRFTPAILMEAFPKLKYIIDLTNTTYYNQMDFTNAGIEYQKINIPGHAIPSLNMVKRFYKIMENIAAKCKPDELIGVHCTHGINRTGYLICRYLVQQLGWDLDTALEAFTKARGYSIERANYVGALRTTSKNAKIDVSKINLDAPLHSVKQTNLERKSTLSMDQSRPRTFMNSAYCRRPLEKFRPLGLPAFGPLQPLPLVGLPPLHGPPLFRPPRAPHRPFGLIHPKPSMRHGPPPPSPPGLHIPGPSRLPPMVGPPIAPCSPVLLPRASLQPGPIRPPPGTPLMMPSKNLTSTTSGFLKRTRHTKDQDFTADVFEENLASKPV